MNRPFLNCTALMTVLVSSLATAVPVTLRTTDGVTVNGEHTAAPKARGIVLLFHQADSNRHEYTPIAVRLAKEGYSSLAIDQRIGGGMFDAKNETALAVNAAKAASYLDVLPDLEAALAWAKRTYPKVKVFAIGSSYSAALLFPLAAKHPELSGIAAFSPAEYLGGSTTVRDAARQVRVPVFVTSTQGPSEVEAARAVYQAVASQRKTQLVPKRFGIHGASLLREDRNFSGGAPEAWTALLTFLRGS